MTKSAARVLDAVALVPAVVLAVSAFSADLVAITGHDVFGVWAFLPVGPVSGDWFPVEVSSTGLLLLAIALVRRKPLGFWLALAAMAGALAVRVPWSNQPVAAAAAMAMALILIATRGRYRVASGARAMHLAVGLVVVACLVGLAAGLLVGDVSGGGSQLFIAAGFDFGTSLPDVGTVLVWPWLLVTHLVIIVAILLTLTPATDRRTAAQLAGAGQALSEHGRGALLPYQLATPCRPVGSTAGNAALAYALAGRTAVVLGDPAGDSAEARRMLASWIDQARAFDWLPVVYQASPGVVADLQVAGWHAACIGSEAIIDPMSFDPTTPRLANVRHTVTRSQKGGVRVVVSLRGALDLPEAARPAALAGLDEAWRAQAGPSMGFTVGRFEPARLDGAGLAVALSAEDVPVAFVVVRPTGGDGGWMLDLMRRRPGSVPGVVEACIVAVTEALGRDGVRRFSLGLAPLGGLNPRRGPLAERTLGLIARLARPAYDADGLAFFKGKFDPSWEPRYLVVAHRWQFMAAAIGLLRLHLGVSWQAVVRSLVASLNVPPGALRLRRRLVG